MVDADTEDEFTNVSTSQEFEQLLFETKCQVIPSVSHDMHTGL